MGKSMVTDGIIKCKYHPNNLNINWCSKCGNPICENCIAEVPKLIMGFGYPDICPRCQQNILNFYLKICLVLFISVIALLSVLEFLMLPIYTFMIYPFITSVVGLSGFLIYFIAIYFKERKKYSHWIENINERNISNEEIQQLIQNQQLKPCYFHNNTPAINNCDECEKNICINCSTIYTRFMGVYFSCIECYWHKRKRDLKLFMKLFFSLLILFLIAFISLTIIMKGKNPLSFYILIIFSTLLFGVLFFSQLFYYKNIKNRYIKWKNEISIMG